MLILGTEKWDNGIAQVWGSFCRSLLDPEPRRSDYSHLLCNPKGCKKGLRRWPESLSHIFSLLAFILFRIHSKIIRKKYILNSNLYKSCQKTHAPGSYWFQTKKPGHSCHSHSAGHPTHLSSILVLALSSFAKIWGSWVSSSQAEPQPRTRARSFPVPRGSTPSWHWWKTVGKTCP